MEKTTPVASGSKPKRWYRKRNVLIDVAVIVAVLVIIALVWWIGHRPKSEPVPSVPQFSGQALVDEVNKKYGQHDYNGAIKLLQGQKSIGEADTRLLLGAAYANKEDYKASLEIYKKLDQEGRLTNVNDIATAGDIAALAGDKQAAIGFYKKAVQRISTEAAPTGSDQIATYEAKIAELEKQ